MAKCELCGNEYDKAFTISQGGKNHVLIASNARSRFSHRRARIAAAGSSATDSKTTECSIAAHTAPSPPASPAFGTGSCRRIATRL